MTAEVILPILMFLTLMVVLFSGYPVAFALGGVAVAFGTIGIAIGEFSPAEFNNIVYRIWGGTAENVLLVCVPMYIFMGMVLEKSGIAEQLLDTMARLLASVPGGVALAVTIIGTILAASTGIISASVVMIAMISLPTMLRLGYNKELAVGTICASGVLGILIPPSIMLVIIGDLLQISVGDLFMGAVLPGLLLSALYCLYIVILCALRPELAPTRTDIERLPAMDVLILVARSLAPPLTLILVVLGSIFFGWATPTEAAGVGAFGAVLLALVHKGFRALELGDVVVRSARTVGMVFAVILGATAFSYVFRSLGGDTLVEDFLRGLPFGPWFILFVIMLVIFFLGFVIEWLEIVLIVLPLVFPIIRGMDFGTHVVGADVHIWFAILVAVNLQTSFLTPPFGFALFYVKGMAPPSVTLMHIYRGIIPFVVFQLVGLGITMAFPAIATWLPKLAYS